MVWFGFSGAMASHLQLKNMFVRNFSSVPTPSPDKANSSGPTSNPDSGQGIRRLTVPTELQKFALVLSGKYKSKADIPEAVSIEVLERARSRARIKISNILMVLTLMGCLGYAYSGRQAASRGESVSQMNLDWHKEYQEQLRQEAAAKATK